MLSGRNCRKGHEKDSFNDKQMRQSTTMPSRSGAQHNPVPCGGPLRITTHRPGRKERGIYDTFLSPSSFFFLSQTSTLTLTWSIFLDFRWILKASIYLLVFNNENRPFFLAKQIQSIWNSFYFIGQQCSRFIQSLLQDFIYFWLN